MFRFLALPAVLAAGVALGALVPEVSNGARALWSATGLGAPAKAAREGGDTGHAQGGHAHEDHAHGGGETASEGVVTLSPEQIAAAKITVAPVGAGILARKLTVPGTVTPDAERVARVAAKVIGTVAELRKRLGDPVEKGEVVAVLDSREVADAKNDYIAAHVGRALQETLFERDHALRDKGISAEQVFLKARTALIEARLKVDLARQKLSALGVPDAEVDTLAEKPNPTKKFVSVEDEHMAGLDLAPKLGLQRYELRAPIAGRIIERRVDVGAPVNDEGQEKEIYTIADLSWVWVELAVPTGDLGAIKEGQAVALTTGDEKAATTGRIVFVSPMLDAQTRSAKVIASVRNETLAWRPGSYATVQVAVEQDKVRLRLPRSALHTIAGEQVVFVRTRDGFEKREVVTGKADADAVEIVFGLDPGEEVAVTNAFILKAELGKAEAEHEH
ncbi:efflux RND transporter periplasmic adaptor subunit [Methylobacterium planeticum]|uniref:Efflux RND transporter periplasmic adaptor subunit n=1 Tax=Methylobacterium planeticum TaxID=2615211 RepID=A0A6N6MKE8_9HYPH|nr:efflux RND transporter periplasmic adaptor subunit [Methylobacterium planeticum]KAB1070120.1 efflux RND transporter periplasmic adaptor subunit [Methylobacterium planeticum]